MEHLINALYNRFLLRDLFGKIVPASIFLLALSFRLDLTTPLLDAMSASAVPAIILAAGTAWITAFLLQQLGETTRYLRYWTSALTDRTTRYDRRIQFLRCATVDERHQLERLIVIKEATGLASVATVLSTAIWISTLYPAGLPFGWSGFKFAVVLVLLLAAAWLLRQSHLRHCERQFAFEDGVLAQQIDNKTGVEAATLLADHG